jgi:glutamate formiminotransferase
MNIVEFIEKRKESRRQEILEAKLEDIRSSFKLKILDGRMYVTCNGLAVGVVPDEATIKQAIDKVYGMQEAAVHYGRLIL